MNEPDPTFEADIVQMPGQVPIEMINSDSLANRKDIQGSFDIDKEDNSILILQDERGRLLDKKGRLVNKYGYLIDEQNNVINSQGQIVFRNEQINYEDNSSPESKFKVSPSNRIPEIKDEDNKFEELKSKYRKKINEKGVGQASFKSPDEKLKTKGKKKKESANKKITFPANKDEKSQILERSKSLRAKASPKKKIKENVLLEFNLIKDSPKGNKINTENKIQESENRFINSAHSKTKRLEGMNK